MRVTFCSFVVITAVDVEALGLPEAKLELIRIPLVGAELDHVEDMNTMLIRKLTVLEAHRLDRGVVLNSIHQLIHVLVGI